MVVCFFVCLFAAFFSLLKKSSSTSTMFAKGCLVLLCASLMACTIGAAEMNPRHSFRAEHEYTFDYNGQIASSMSNGEQYSASRFRALVKLNFLTDKTVIVRLENPQLGQ
uniref:Vitellogenin domain-containing protein n=1 Tax=Panagrolaimus sp. PS1159 TaxID=55785 RepID=A0AC35EVB6_9BILA